jgi:hypothetical protein
MSHHTPPPGLTAAADQDLARIEEYLDHLIGAWRDSLDDDEVQAHLPSKTSRVAVLHNILDDLPLPRVSITAVLAAAINRAVENTSAADELAQLEGILDAEQ